MISMTEEEAKTKWCPFTRFCANNGVAFNNRQDSYAEDAREISCIGSKCMAWRVSEYAQPAQTATRFIEWRDGEEKPSTEFEESGWTLADAGEEGPDDEDDYTLYWEEYTRVTKAACPAKGYCGLAGKP